MPCLIITLIIPSDTISFPWISYTIQTVDGPKPGSFLYISSSDRTCVEEDNGELQTWGIVYKGELDEINGKQCYEIQALHGKIFIHVYCIDSVYNSVNIMALLTQCVFADLVDSVPPLLRQQVHSSALPPRLLKWYMKDTLYLLAYKLKYYQEMFSK